MEKDIDLYLKNQNDSSKLIYTLGILWGKINNKLDATLSPYNLNVSKFNILMIIKHVGGENGIQQNAISKRLLVTPSNITKLLDKLEKDSMIIRGAKENDRRVKLIKITPSASKLLDEIWPIYLNQVSLLTSSLKKDEINLLEKMQFKWLAKIK